jgi:hypothetical protein
MLFSFRSYGSETDMINEIQILSRQPSEIWMRKPVLFHQNWEKISLEKHQSALLTISVSAKK